jgi:hypothetical protein
MLVRPTYPKWRLGDELDGREEVEVWEGDAFHVQDPCLVQPKWTPQTAWRDRHGITEYCGRWRHIVWRAGVGDAGRLQKRAGAKAENGRLG